MNPSDIDSVDAIACKMSHKLSSCNPPRARKKMYHFFLITFLVE